MATDGLILPDDNALWHIGVGGIVALLIIREVLAFLAKKKDRETAAWSEKQVYGFLRSFEKVVLQVAELHKWHAVETDGVKIWYVRQTLENAIVALAAGIEKQTDLMREWHEELRDIRRDMRSGGRSRG